jgi:FdrA protein
MILRSLLKRNTYYDSITLMTTSQAIKDQVDIDDIGIVMATEANRMLLQNAGLLTDALLAGQETMPGPEDLLIVVRAKDEALAGQALAAVEQALTATRKGVDTISTQEPPARSLEVALRRNELANLALISVAGERAPLEAEQALRNGLHVFLFSNNVPVEDEQRLKASAASKGLLLMGPDCGTAIINGAGLGFSNVVPRGPVGIVGASGTGMQELACLLCAAGIGVSQAIGTGSRDLSEAIGGVTARRGLELLAADGQTQVIVLVSKLPAERVAFELLQAAHLTKPVVAVLLGTAPERFSSLAGNVTLARTLTEGAEAAVKLAGGESGRVPGAGELLKKQERLAAERAALAPSQRYVRALYSGGTLCYEAMLLLGEQVGRLPLRSPDSAAVDALASLETGIRTSAVAGPLASNIALHPDQLLAPGEVYRGHTALDLGADEFTQGRPHPMIDPTVRLQYLARAAADPATAVILLDIVLGFCSHPDPAAAYVPTIARLRSEARAAGRSLPVIVSLCGTEGDPQGLSRQRAALEAAGALVFESNVAAARAAASIINEEGRIHD